MINKRKYLFVFIFVSLLVISLSGVYRFVQAYTLDPSNYNIVGLISSIFVVIGYIIAGLYFYKRSKEAKSKDKQ